MHHSITFTAALAAGALLLGCAGAPSLAPSEQTVAAHVARATALAGDDMKALMRLCNPAPARQMSPEEGDRYIAGEIAMRACERSLGTILREDICIPLEVDFQIGTPESEHARCAEMRKPSRGGDFGEITTPRKAAFFTKWAAPVRGSTQWRKIEIPSANGHGNARSVARLFEAYATGGVIAGTRIVSESAFAALATQRSFGADLVLPFPVDWRTGVMGNSNGFYGPNPEAFGHAGMGGSVGFGDPVARVSVGYVMNKQSHHLAGDPRSLALIGALYACL